jgi:diguanylate cyclase (GGDEF)-like protein
MNLTVKRLKEMFEEEAKRLESVRREANYDALTGLPNRSFFMTQLREALHTEETAFGACMFLRIAHLADVNKKHGRVVTDEIIRRIARHIHAYSEKMDDSLACRLNGSDFALLISSDDPQSVAQSLMADVVRDIAEYCENGFCASIGMASYHKGIALPTLLGQIDMALADAEAQANNSVRMADSTDTFNTPKTMEGWSQLVRSAIADQRMYLLSFPVGAFAGGLLHREGPMRIRESDESPWIPAGKFLPFAERLGLTDALDLAAVRMGLQTIEQQPDHVGYAVNLSPSSLKVSTFLPALKKLVQAHPQSSRKLWLELPEAGVLKQFDEFRELCLALKETGVRLGIEHFGRQFDHIGLLHDLGLDYVKVDASFVRDVDKNLGNQSFLKGLVVISHGIGMLVIAEGVLTADEMAMLQALGFDGATGPAVKET